MPPNTTSKLQPLDLGIIQNFKTHYRKLLLRYVLSKIDDCETASEVAKSVIVLKAIRGVASAWSCVQEETISKCFRKCGIVSEDGCVVSRVEVDPFADIDGSLNAAVEVDAAAQQEVQALVNAVTTTDTVCSVHEYVNEDNELEFCFDLSNDQWENDFFASLRQTPESPSHDCTDEPRESDDEGDATTTTQPAASIPPPEPKINSIRGAIQSLEEVQYFLQFNGHTVGSSLSSIMDSLAEIQSKNLVHIMDRNAIPKVVR